MQRLKKIGANRVLEKKWTIVLILLFVGINSVYAQFTPEFNRDIQNLALLSGREPAIQAYEQINLIEAWDQIADDPQNLADVVLGIIDSGVDSTHPEFNGIDFGNTFPDGLHDRGFINADGNLVAHGTKVAGIVGANNISSDSPEDYRLFHMNGVITGVDNLGFKIESRNASIRNIIHPKGAYDFVQVLGFAYNLGQVEQGAIINMSMSIDPVPGSFGIYREAFRLVFDANPDDLYIVSAGNEGKEASDFIPASLSDLDNVITVGAVKFDDSRFVGESSASNFGSAVTLAAPGAVETFIQTPSFYVSGNENPNLDDYDLTFSDTSAAAPFVTGVAGLLRAINLDLTPLEIRNILISTGDAIVTDEPIGPRLNAFAAVCHEDVLDCKSTITIDKTVINNDGGTSNPSEFSFLLDGEPLLQGVPIDVEPGEHTLVEIPLAGYTATSWGGNCDSSGTFTIELNEDLTCTITNDDIPPPPAPALRQLTSTTFGSSFSPAISGDGMLVAFISNADHAGENPTNLTELYTVDADGSNLTKDTVNTPPFQFGQGRSIDIDADGSTFALTSGSNPLGTNPESNVEVFSLDNGTLRQLTSSTVSIRNESISITNDGSTIAFVSTGNYATNNADLSREVFTVSATGGTFQQLTNNIGTVDDARISGDGSTVIFTTRDVFGKRSLHAVDTTTNTISLIATNVTINNTPVFSLNISDDGSRTAFIGNWNPLGTNPSGSSRAFTMKVDGTETYQLSGTLSVMLALSGDGNTVAFSEGSGIEAANFDGTDKRTVFTDLGATSPTSLDIVGMTLVFDSQADPLGTNVDGNTEIFLQTL